MKIVPCSECGNPGTKQGMDICSDCYTKRLIDGADNAHADGYCTVCERYFVGRKICGCAAKETL